MLRVVSALFLILISAVTSHARIGETRVESIDRYGPEMKGAVAMKKVPTASWSRFQSGKFILDIAFVEMQTAVVHYSQRTVLISPPDVLKILAAEGTGWLPFVMDEPMRSNTQRAPIVYLRSKEGLIAEMLPVYCAGVTIYTEWAFTRIFGQPLARKDQEPSL
ncbi:MAG TPA: hypothetical protein VF585_12155 [Chthoniobacterales bacterium]